MITVNEAKRLAKKNLSAKRFEHTMNVRRLAVELAERNDVSKDKASLAALLHDIAKEMSRERLLQILSENDIIQNNILKRSPAVWHGEAAAALAKMQYGVEDEEILSAIRCHTTGKAGMFTLDKIIYVADMASYERLYPQAETLRAHALKNLDEATIEALGMSIAWLKADGKAVDENTLEAYAELRTQYYGGKTIEKSTRTP